MNLVLFAGFLEKIFTNNTKSQLDSLVTTGEVFYILTLELLTDAGTIVQAWSSPEALAKCKQFEPTLKPKVHSGDKADPNHPSLLWNAMIYPILPMTINGKLELSRGACNRLISTCFGESVNGLNLVLF